MRPWFIPDWYQENGGSPTTFTSPPDIYTFPGYDPDLPPASGRGLGSAVVFHNNGGPSSYGQLDVGSGGSAIQYAIEHCYNGPPFSVGDIVWTKPGGTLGPERSGVESLLAWDPDSGGVHWDPAKKEVVGGCSSTGTCNCGSQPCPYGGAQSPRIVQAAICSPSEASCAGTVPGRNQIHITNILSFFITGYTINMGNLDINAILIGSAGLLEPGPTVGPGESFLNVTMLVR
jgi:hypothetical protein